MISDLNFNLSYAPVQFIRHWKERNITLFVKREDLLHPQVSGNKYRKLKYNFQQAKVLQIERVLTFGGAYSNHIAAVAAAGKMLGFKTIGIIRGEELGEPPGRTLRKNPTLHFAATQGMHLQFITRASYRLKNEPEFLEKLKEQFGDFYLIPEGGTNYLAVKGCEEILGSAEKDFDVVCCPVGTGGTIAGIINSSNENQHIIGFPALKGDFLKEEIRKYTFAQNWRLQHNYHFGGYAKVSTDLVQFINEFKLKYQIALDPVYTGKMFFGIFDMIEKGAISENSRILAIHTGGLQGIAGMNELLKQKSLPTIIV